MAKRGFLQKLTGLDAEEPAEEKNNLPPAAEPEPDQWSDDDYSGQLSVDVFQNPTHIVIKSTIAGVKPEDIDIAVEGDVVTIKGKREHEESGVVAEDYFYQECYWGGFSRSIVLPQEVKTEGVQATLKNGVLTIKLPKAKKNKTIAIKVREE